MQQDFASSLVDCAFVSAPAVRGPLQWSVVVPVVAVLVLVVSRPRHKARVAPNVRVQGCSSTTDN
jgi:hypothetical protein